MIKKDKLFSNNKPLIVIGKLFLLQILMLLFGFAISGGGHGTYIQFPIFYGWLMFPVLHLKDFVISSDNFSPLLINYLFFIPIVFFLFSLLLTILIFKQKISRRLLKIIISLHFLGALLTLVTSSQDLWSSFFSPFAPSSPYIWFAGLTIAIIVDFFFWKIFFNTLFNKN